MKTDSKTSPPLSRRRVAGNGVGAAPIKTHKNDLEAYKRIASAYGRMARGKKKTMSPLAIQARRNAGRISAMKRGFYCK